MTWPVWAGLAVGVAFACAGNPRAVRDLAAAIVAVGSALALPIAAGLALLAGHAAPRRHPGRPSPPPTAPPRRTAGLTLGQTLRRLYVTEDTISGAQYATLYGAAFDAHVLERLLPVSAGVDEVLEALTARPPIGGGHSEIEEAAAAAVAGGDYLEPLTRPRALGKEGDVMQLHDGETVEHAEQRAGRVITETHEVRTGATGGYVLARLGPVLHPRAYVDLCDCRGVAGDVGPCTDACRAPGAPRDPTNREHS